MKFACSPFGQFMAGTLGRILRFVAGVALIAAGWWMLGSIWGPVLIAVGLVPLIAGTFDVCFISVLFGGPFPGQAIRDCRAGAA